MPSALTLVLWVIAAWLILGAAGLAAPRRLRFISRVLFPASAALGLLLAIVALGATGEAPATAVLPLGLPDLPFHVRLDALSAFFLLLLGAAIAGISLFSRRLLSRGRRSARPDCCASSTTRFSRHGDGADRRRRVRVHGRVGDDGARRRIFLVTTEHRDPGNPPRGIPLSPDCAHRRASPSCCASACCRAGAATTRSTRCARATSTARWPTDRVLARAASASAPRPACCRCTCGCRRRIRRRRRRCRR